MKRSSDEPPSDPRAQVEEMAEKHLAVVAKTLARYGVPRNDLPDAAQEVLLTAFEILQRDPQVIDKPKSWLGTIARRTASDVRKHTDCQPALVPLEECSGFACEGARAEAGQARRDLLYRLLDEVEGSCRPVIIDRSLEEMSWEETASRNGLSIAGAKWRHQKGLTQMRAALDRWGAEQRRRGAAVLPVGLPMLFEADRAPFELSEEFRSLVRESLARRLDALEGMDAFMSREAPPRRSVRPPKGAPSVHAPSVIRVPSFGLGSALGLLTVGLGVGFVIGWLLGRKEPTSPGPLERYGQAPIVAVHWPVSSAPGPDVIAPSGSGAAVVLTATTAQAALPRPSVRMASKSLREERDLLEEAESSRGKRHWQAALAALRQHRTQFPKGQYVGRREALIAAICAQPEAMSQDDCAKRAK